MLDNSHVPGRDAAFLTMSPARTLSLPVNILSELCKAIAINIHLRSDSCYSVEQMPVGGLTKCTEAQGTARPVSDSWIWRKGGGGDKGSPDLQLAYC